jgi:hypothetical protein
VIPPNPAAQPSSGIEIRNPEFEVQTARERTREALAWMSTHPGEIAAMVPAKVYLMYKDDRGAYPWIEEGLRKRLGPGPRRWLDALLDGYWLAVLVLAVVGTRHLLGGDGRAAILPIAVAWFTLVHAVLFFGNARFHHPLLPVLSLMAAAELVTLTGRARAA